MFVVQIFFWLQPSRCAFRYSFAIFHGYITANALFLWGAECADRRFLSMLFPCYSWHHFTTLSPRFFTAYSLHNLIFCCPFAVLLMSVFQLHFTFSFTVLSPYRPDFCSVFVMLLLAARRLATRLTALSETRQKQHARQRLRQVRCCGGHPGWQQSTMGQLWVNYSRFHLFITCSEWHFLVLPPYLNGAFFLCSFFVQRPVFPLFVLCSLPLATLVLKQ